MSAHAVRGEPRSSAPASPLPWFADLGLRWHAVPAISNMCLEIGGNGHRDRRPQPGRRRPLRPAAPGRERLGLDTGRERSLWRDRVLVERILAVLACFDAAGVTIADHHTESSRFLTHLTREERARRITPGRPVVDRPARLRLGHRAVPPVL